MTSENRNMSYSDAFIHNSDIMTMTKLRNIKFYFKHLKN